jgi:hypothetical protein
LFWFSKEVRLIVDVTRASRAFYIAPHPRSRRFAHNRKTLLLWKSYVGISAVWVTIRVYTQNHSVINVMAMLRQFTSDSHASFDQSRVHLLDLQPGRAATENEDMDGMARSDLFAN